MIQDTSSQDRLIARPRKQRTLWLLVATGLGLALLIGLFLPKWNTWSRAELSFDEARINQAVVTRGNLTRDLGVEGKIIASSYPTLYSPSEGTITLKTKPGNQVSRGDLLAVVQSPELANLLQQESAQAESARIAWERQKIEERTSQLKQRQDVALKKLEMEAAKRASVRARLTFNKGLIGEAEYESAGDRLDIASLEYNNAVEQEKLDREVMAFETRTRELAVRRQDLILDEARRRVAQLEIRSPVDGVIGSLSVDPSDLVKTNQALLTVIDLSAFEIEISIPEMYADEITPGVEAEIIYENQTYAGLVGTVAPEVTGATVKGTVVFQGDLPHGLKQNQRVSTRIILSSKQNVLKIRRGPFLESDGGRSAYIVNDALAQVQPIRTGAVSLTEIEILEGLTEGDTVIISDTSIFQGAKTVFLRK